MTILRAVLDAIVAHAREEAPLECCGLLIGRGERITASHRAANLEASPTRYQIDPAEHIRARRQARSAGDKVLGFYHSHPASTPEPSASDRAEASYPEAVWLIVGLSGEPEVRAFTINDGEAAAVRLEVEE